MAQSRASSVLGRVRDGLRYGRLLSGRHALKVAEAGSEGASLIDHYRAHGHLEAELDPLRRCCGPLAKRWPALDACESIASAESLTQALATKSSSSSSSASSSRSSRRRFSSKDMVFVGEELGHVQRHPWWDRDELVCFLRSCYCGTMSVQASHLNSAEQRQWWQQAAEVPHSKRCPPPQEQRQLLKRLLHATLFEQFLSSHYPSTRRFGLDGCESLVSGLWSMCRHLHRLGVENVELGMAHRGRLNVLHNILGKRMGLICAEMKEDISDFHVGDVKYHLGVTGQLFAEEDDAAKLDAGDSHRAPLNLSITPNPSHLEVVVPVVLGRVRALQDLCGDASARQKVLGVLIHGDAAFSGLGVIQETLQLSRLTGYTTGGTVHIILNNQIGFTTEPFQGRSSPHPSDIALGLSIPVIHVNADDVEAVDRAFALAAQWRNEFLEDIIIDLVCYRRFGHNELDIPEITQPVSCQLMKCHPDAARLYEKKLIEAGVMDTGDVEAMRTAILQQLKTEHEERGQYRQDGLAWIRDYYGGKAFRNLERDTEGLSWATGIPISTLQKILRLVFTIPDGFSPHPHVAKLFDKRRKAAVDAEGRLDFATAEALAFGSILLWRASLRDKKDDTPLVLPARNVRLSGQDCRRGTFNQRHASILDACTSNELVPLSSMVHGQMTFQVHNSPLSEMAVLAFEYGYSLGDPQSLVCWEAQFGDFANNAQVVIDQFIASGEERWDLTSSLTLLLPHGYEGQGPDHSSARLERFLALANDDPDNLPGSSMEESKEIDRAFDLLSDGDGVVRQECVFKYLGGLGTPDSMEFQSFEELWAEMGRGEDLGHGMNRHKWRDFMLRWFRRSAEARANIFVVNVTTPAQYFHVLRRQAHRNYKKPLVVMTPKYLLHHVKATSSMKDLGPGTFFRRVIADYSAQSEIHESMADNTRHLAMTKTGKSLLEERDRVRRLIICTGQIYYHLSNARHSRKIKDISILRLEQIAPFPHDLIMRVISAHPNAEVVWCQEEPKNMGAWFYVRPRLRRDTLEASKILGERANGGRVPIRYIGRPVAATTATGSQHIHRQEMKQILDSAFDGCVVDGATAGEKPAEVMT